MTHTCEWCGVDYDCEHCINEPWCVSTCPTCGWMGENYGGKE